MLDALGNERARDNVRGLRTVAECSGPDDHFVTTVTSLRPDTVYFHQQTGLGATEIWSTPDRTWGGSNQEAYAELAPAVRELVRRHEFHLMLIDLPNRFSNFTMQGEAQVGDIPCLHITMTDEFGAAAAICIGEADGLPVELQLVTERDDGPIRIEFADWRVVDGINWFHAFRLTESSEDFHYEFIEIETSSFGHEADIAPPPLPRRESGES
ncbi:MAG TPA: hypothetical protein VF389_11090 [Woeseiaceae bacterium]